MPNAEITFTLPFPPKELAPNARLHWAQKEEKRKAQKEAGHYLAYPFRGKLGQEYVSLSLLFVPADRRCFDLDGLLSRSKYALDGVATGLGINDKQFRPITLDIGEPDAKNPRVDVTIGVA
jgi:crossover junction endodeoxyribonuclease RusA